MTVLPKLRAQSSLICLGFPGRSARKTQTYMTSCTREGGLVGRFVIPATTVPSGEFRLRTEEGQPPRGAGLRRSRCSEMAEDEGFEPSVSFPTHDFQSCALGH